MKIIPCSHRLQTERRLFSEWTGIDSAATSYPLLAIVWGTMRLAGNEVSGSLRPERPLVIGVRLGGGVVFVGNCHLVDRSSGCYFIGEVWMIT
ncbi:hypothetical protein CEXT_76821 [Caerostris extrusa]|uniref:Uncharacterized protein n=1 Tax=Caerostris extrusa TaxID=172846 RepID=A0AAV4PN61_CAEEX|nr:hypothetical protein CEXT_76821 [Caerostris extrusa]